MVAVQVARIAVVMINKIFWPISLMEITTWGLHCGKNAGIRSQVAKNRKNRKCCPGHSLSINAMSWLEFLNLPGIVNCVTKSLHSSQCHCLCQMCLRQLCSALKRLKSKGHWLTDKVTYWAVQDISHRLPKQSSSDLVRGADRRLPKRLKIRKTTVPTVKS